MEQEIWKDIPGYEGIYQASTLGRIKSLTRKVGKRCLKEKILATKFKNARYGRAVLKKDGYARSYELHQLIALTFLDPKPGYEVHHKDGDGQNNSLHNLEYLSRSEHRIKEILSGNIKMRFSKEQILSIRKSTLTLKELSKMYNCGLSAIENIRKGKCYKYY